MRLLASVATLVSRHRHLPLRPPVLRHSGPSTLTTSPGGCRPPLSARPALRLHQPAFAVDVVDTTGAGDVFHGTYLYAVLQGWPVRRCLAFAAATAALKCQELGGRAGIPMRQQVEPALED